MTLDYAARQLAGVWKMAWGGAEWRALLDRSLDGVFRSFWALAFAAPLAFVSYVSLRRAAQVIPDFPENALLKAPFAAAFAAEAVGYCADWAASLAVLVLAAQRMKAERRVADAIIGFNWLQVYVGALQAAPLAVMSFTGNSPVAGLLLLPSTALIIALYWGVIRRTLEPGVGPAIALIVLLMLVGIIINSIVGAVAISLLQLSG